MSSEGLMALALQAFEAQRHGEAEAACREALAQSPCDVPALVLLGKVLHAKGQYAEASEWLQQAAKIEPDSIGVLSRLGSAYYAAKDYTRAADCFARCIQLAPDCAGAYHELGKTCFAIREIELAVKLCRRALQLDPSNFKTWNNLGSALRDLVQLEEALAAYDKALELCPDSARVHWNRALVLMKMGRLVEGFREYEWRRPLLEARFAGPGCWQGEPIPDKTLFLMAEQGFGDMIHFVRFARWARLRAGRVILECQPELKSLFEFSGCADEITLIRQKPPAFDLRCPLISLPAILETTFESLPAEVPYLRSPPGKPLPDMPAGWLRVGLVWAGNPKHDDNARRNIPLQQFAQLLETPRITFFSLQMPLSPQDQSQLQRYSNVIDLTPQLADFAATASVIGQLDLVISVDTAVAHLAGALGKPVWTLVQHSADWRWFVERLDSPWYPTMRLFRQHPRNDWQSALAMAKSELCRLAAETQGGPPRG